MPSATNHQTTVHASTMFRKTTAGARWCERNSAMTDGNQKTVHRAAMTSQIATAAAPDAASGDNEATGMGISNTHGPATP